LSLCWDCLQNKEQQVSQHGARPSDVGAAASGEEGGFVSVAGLDSLQSASVGSSDGGGAQKPQETWLKKHFPKIDEPPKPRGPAPGHGGAPKKQWDPREARRSEISGADARATKQRRVGEAQAAAMEAKRAGLAAQLRAAEATASARVAAAEAEDAARAAAVALEQRAATDKTLQAVRGMLQGLIDSRATITEQHQRELDAVLRQTLTLGDLRDPDGSVLRRLEFIAELATSISTDFHDAQVLHGTAEDPLGAGRGVLVSGYGATITESIGALLELRRLTALAFNDVLMGQGEGVAAYIARARTESAVETQECAAELHRLAWSCLKTLAGLPTDAPPEDEEGDYEEVLLEFVLKMFGDTEMLSPTEVAEYAEGLPAASLAMGGKVVSMPLLAVHGASLMSILWAHENDFAALG
jgi:hypothetical protein